MAEFCYSCDVVDQVTVCANFFLPQQKHPSNLFDCEDKNVEWKEEELEGINAEKYRVYCQLILEGQQFYGTQISGPGVTAVPTVPVKEECCLPTSGDSAVEHLDETGRSNGRSNLADPQNEGGTSNPLAGRLSHLGKKKVIFGYTFVFPTSCKELSLSSSLLFTVVEVYSGVCVGCGELPLFSARGVLRQGQKLLLLKPFDLLVSKRSHHRRQQSQYIEDCCSSNAQSWSYDSPQYSVVSEEDLLPETEYAITECRKRHRDLSLPWRFSYPTKEDSSDDLAPKVVYPGLQSMYHHCIVNGVRRKPNRSRSASCHKRRFRSSSHDKVSNNCSCNNHNTNFYSPLKPYLASALYCAEALSLILRGAHLENHVNGNQQKSGWLTDASISLLKEALNISLALCCMRAPFLCVTLPHFNTVVLYSEPLYVEAPVGPASSLPRSTYQIQASSIPAPSSPPSNSYTSRGLRLLGSNFANNVDSASNGLAYPLNPCNVLSPKSKMNTYANSSTKQFSSSSASRRHLKTSILQSPQHQLALHPSASLQNLHRHNWTGLSPVRAPQPMLSIPIIHSSPSSSSLFSANASITPQPLHSPLPRVLFSEVNSRPLPYTSTKLPRLPLMSSARGMSPQFSVKKGSWLTEFGATSWHTRQKVLRQYAARDNTITNILDGAKRVECELDVSTLSPRQQHKTLVSNIPQHTGLNKTKFLFTAKSSACASTSLMYSTSSNFQSGYTSDTISADSSSDSNIKNSYSAFSHVGQPFSNYTTARTPAPQSAESVLSASAFGNGSYTFIGRHNSTNSGFNSHTDDSKTNEFTAKNTSVVSCSNPGIAVKKGFFFVDFDTFRDHPAEVKAHKLNRAEMIRGRYCEMY